MDNTKQTRQLKVYSSRLHYLRHRKEAVPLYALHHQHAAPRPGRAPGLS